MCGVSKDNSNTSGTRTTVYTFGAAVLAIAAYYVDAESSEIALWQAGLAAAIPLGALVMATIRTWPKKAKSSSTDADG